MRTARGAKRPASVARVAALCLLTTFLLLAAAARTATTAVASTQADAAVARIPALFKNCTAVHRRYPHGVGRVGAADHTASGADPVTNFKRSTRLYNLAMRYNRGLDRDHDGIACEKL